MKKKKKVKISKFEKFLYTLTCFLLLVSPIFIVFTKSTLSEVNYEVEKIKREIASQEKENESLKMKINELASLDNVQGVATTYGLEYNNSNIRVVGE